MNLRTDIALERATNVRYVVLAWACTLSMITYIDRVCISKVAPDMTRDLGLTENQFAWVFASFGLAYALFEVPSGWLGDKFGPRLVLCRIVLWWSLFTALTGLVYSFSWDLGWFTFNSLALLVIIRFLFGAGEAGAYPNIARSLRNWFPYSRRGLAQGLLWMFGRWGGAVAPFLVVLVAGGAGADFTLGLGWRGAFIVFGAVGAVWVVAFAVFFRDHPDQHPGVNEAERAYIRGSVAEAVKPPPMSWGTALSSPTLWCLSLMYFCSNAGWCFFITWHVRYYQTVLGLQGDGLTIALGAPLFFGGIACLGGGFITDWMVRVLGRRWGRTAQGAVAYFCGGAFFAAALFAHETPWLAVACLCMASFLKDFAMAASWSTCIDIGHRYSGTISGFMNMVGNFGTFFSPPIIAWLATSGGPGAPTRWDLALVYSSVMFFIASLGWLFINPKRVIVYRAEDVPPSM
jgi:MFS family permease